MCVVPLGPEVCLLSSIPCKLEIEVPGFVVLLETTELDCELSIKSMLWESSTEHRWCLVDSQSACEADELADYAALLDATR